MLVFDCADELFPLDTSDWGKFPYRLIKLPRQLLLLDVDGYLGSLTRGPGRSFIL